VLLGARRIGNLIRPSRRETEVLQARGALSSVGQSSWLTTSRPWVRVPQRPLAAMMYPSPPCKALSGQIVMLAHGPLTWTTRGASQRHRCALTRLRAVPLPKATYFSGGAFDSRVGGALGTGLRGSLTPTSPAGPPESGGFTLACVACRWFKVRSWALANRSSKSRRPAALSASDSL
jgi:hypothetical protein